jgi:hypothetical protein
MKRRSITLMPSSDGAKYRVLSISNSLNYSPDEWLTKDVVETLCGAENGDVYP